MYGEVLNMDTEKTEERIKNKAEKMKSLLYKPISEHDEVWYFGWFGMLSRGKYKVAKFFSSYCFSKKKDAVKFHSIKRELFDDICNLVDEEIEVSLYKNAIQFRETRTTISSSDLIEDNKFAPISIADISPLREGTDSSKGSFT